MLADLGAAGLHLFVVFLRKVLPGSQGKPTDVACMLCVIRKHDLQVGMWSGQMGSPLNCPQRGALRS